MFVIKHAAARFGINFICVYSGRVKPSLDLNVRRVDRRKRGFFCMMLMELLLQEYKKLED